MVKEWVLKEWVLKEWVLKEWGMIVRLVLRVVGQMSMLWSRF